MATKILFTPKTQTQEEPTVSSVKSSGKGFAENASDFLGMTNFAKGIGLSAARTPIIGDIFAPEVRSLQKKIDAGTATDAELEAYANIYNETAPTDKQIVGSAISTGANFIPGVGKGANLTTKIATGAGTGYAMDVGTGLQKEDSLGKALTPNVGTYVGAALPIMGAIFGKGAKNFSAQSLEQESLRLNPTEKKNLLRKGQDIAKYISDKKIVGNPSQRYEKIDTIYDAMEDKIQGVIKKSGVSYGKQEVIDKLKEIPGQFSNDITGYDEIASSVEKAIKNIQKNQSDQISAEIVNEIKRNAYKRAYAKNATDVISDSNKAIGDKLKSILDEKIGGLEGMNKEYGLAIESRKALRNALDRKQVGMLGTITGYATGVGIGSSFGPIGMAAGGMAGNKIAEIVAGTAARSYSGAAINTVQNLVKKIPTDKAGNLKISQKALINLLENLR